MGRGLAQEIWVLTLVKENSWRMIENFPPHFLGVLDFPDICIVGVLYYGAYLNDQNFFDADAVMSFDVRSETFVLIKIPEKVMFRRLTSYKGKLSIIDSEYSRNIGIYTFTPTCTIYLCVLVNAATHEWLEKKFVVD